MGLQSLQIACDHGLAELKFAKVMCAFLKNKIQSCIFPSLEYKGDVL